MTQPIRCVLLSEMLQPYRIPVFNHIAEDDRVDFEVLLLSVREKNRAWEVDLEGRRFKHRTLPGSDFYIRSLDWGLHFNRGVCRALDEIDPEVVVGTGYVSPAYLTGQKWARRKGAGYVLWSGSTAATSRIGKGPLKGLKQRFVRRCDAYLTYGSLATRQLISLGANPERIITGCNTVDVDEIEALTKTAVGSPEFEAWRSGFPGTLILFVGQMIERKGVRDLIRAFRSVRDRDVGLMIVGDGPLRKTYEAEFRGMERIYWEGFKQKRDLGRYLASANVLVMPSRLEVWGLVVNEAMAAGVPVIATDGSGAAVDLVEDGVTGHTYEAGDEMALATLLKSVVDHPDRWAEMGRNSKGRIQSCRPCDYAARFVEAALLAHSRRAGENLQKG